MLEARNRCRNDLKDSRLERLLGPMPSQSTTPTPTPTARRARSKQAKHRATSSGATTQTTDDVGVLATTLRAALSSVQAAAAKAAKEAKEAAAAEAAAKQAASAAVVASQRSQSAGPSAAARMPVRPPASRSRVRAASAVVRRGRAVVTPTHQRVASTSAVASRAASDPASGEHTPSSRSDPRRDSVDAGAVEAAMALLTTTGADGSGLAAPPASAMLGGPLLDTVEPPVRRGLQRFVSLAEEGGAVGTGATDGEGSDSDGEVTDTGANKARHAAPSPEFDAVEATQAAMRRIQGVANAPAKPTALMGKAISILMGPKRDGQTAVPPATPTMTFGSLGAVVRAAAKVKLLHKRRREARASATGQGRRSTMLHQLRTHQRRHSRAATGLLQERSADDAGSVASGMSLVAMAAARRAAKKFKRTTLERIRESGVLDNDATSLPASPSKVAPTASFRTTDTVVSVTTSGDSSSSDTDDEDQSEVDLGGAASAVAKRALRVRLLVVRRVCSCDSGLLRSCTYVCWYSAARRLDSGRLSRGSLCRPSGSTTTSQSSTAGRATTTRPTN